MFKKLMPTRADDQGSFHTFISTTALPIVCSRVHAKQSAPVNPPLRFQPCIRNIHVAASQCTSEHACPNRATLLMLHRATTSLVERALPNEPPHAQVRIHFLLQQRYSLGLPIDCRLAHWEQERAQQAKHAS